MTARDTALANAEPLDELDRVCLNMAHEYYEQHDGLSSDATCGGLNERDALALAVGAWQKSWKAQAVSYILMPHQRFHEGSEGAVILRGCDSKQREGTRFAATAALALAASLG